MCGQPVANHLGVLAAFKGDEGSADSLRCALHDQRRSRSMGQDPMGDAAEHQFSQFPAPASAHHHQFGVGLVRLIEHDTGRRSDFAHLRDGDPVRGE